jgi:hypothetical protein
MGVVVQLRPVPDVGRPEAPRAGRKACRREVKRTLKRIGWAPPKLDGLRGDDITKLWLVVRCAARGRCPKLVAKLAVLREASR